jgi:dTDP-glucose pyrophosphorylase
MRDSPDKIIGVILAAGKGSRLYPLSEAFPKPILPICNRPLLEYQIEQMKACGISEVLIIIGYMGYAIADTLGHGSQYGVSIRYVEQRETLGLAHALGKLEGIIDSPILLFLGDIFLMSEDLRPAIDDVLSGAVNANLISKIEPDQEMIKRNFAILEGSDGRVRQVIEKPRYVHNQLKGCGVYVFDQHIFDAIRRTPRTAMRDEYEITDSIQILINDGQVVCHRPLVKRDVNLTTPEDLLEINLSELAGRGMKECIGKRVQMPPGTIVDNSVIGDDVILCYPLQIRNSLIFPGSIVQTRRNFNGVIHQGNTSYTVRGGD